MDITANHRLLWGVALAAFFACLPNRKYQVGYNCTGSSRANVDQNTETQSRYVVYSSKQRLNQEMEAMRFNQIDRRPCNAHKPERHLFAGGVGWARARRARKHAAFLLAMSAFLSTLPFAIAPSSQHLGPLTEGCPHEQPGKHVP